MGRYLNPGGEAFLDARASEIYVDKSGLLAYTNKVFRTEQRYVCVSRPRRFGKSMAANMLVAYYDRTASAQDIFRGLTIETSPNFLQYANQYDVLAINMQEFLSRAKDMETLLQTLERLLLQELLREYPGVYYLDQTDLSGCLSDIFVATRRRFVIVIDEWDCIFREYKENEAEQRQYLDFLRAWLKDKTYVGLVYMTGILPIKKYGTHSALNMFVEFSMTDPGPLASYVGFTELEIKQLCGKYAMDFEETKAWYDGYSFDGEKSVYSPRSVVQSMLFHKFNNYWTQTETFEALKAYIDMNFDGLRDAILSLMAGGRQKIDIRSFSNDMTTFHNYEDVLTLLIHLGYLGYDFDQKEVFVPNKEILDEFVTAATRSEWMEIIRSVKKSDALLQATLDRDAVAVAQGIETAHLETSHLQYNDENALSYTVSLAYYSARQYYTMIRELPAGKGFADLVFVPRPKYADKPALLVELKWNERAETAIRQIKEKKYVKALEGCSGEILLIGISYDKETRKHSCAIEKWDTGNAD